MKKLLVVVSFILLSSCGENIIIYEDEKESFSWDNRRRITLYERSPFSGTVLIHNQKGERNYKYTIEEGIIVEEVRDYYHDNGKLSQTQIISNDERFGYIRNFNEMGEFIDDGVGQLYRHPLPWWD